MRTPARTRTAVAAGVAALAIVVALALPAGAEFPFPFPSPGGDPYDYTQLHIQNGSCDPAPGEQTDLPSGFDCKNDFKLTDYAPKPGDPDYDPTVENNPQELFGVKGPGTNRAWEITTGRPDTVIAVEDSGIRWSENTPELVNKFYLNRGELPRPCAAAPCATVIGGSLSDYDANHDGVFNVKDYAADPRVSDHPDDANTYLDPADLIRTFSDGIDQDHNGYADDISGWDFFEGDNNAGDDVSYGHGTGESRDSAAEIELQTTQCPNCMLMELRVGDSFVADINRWAEGVIYAVDSGASVVQEALGTLNHTGFAQSAADYAYRHGVLIVASQADEEAGHHNYPAALNHTMLVNSSTHYLNQGGLPEQHPRTYLAFNGCTNFGGYSWLTISSSSCSSDATGQASGMAGLLYSAARNAVDLGIIDPSRRGRPLSFEEAKQLFRASADDVDFSTPKPPGPPNNFATTIPDSQRYVTTAGWDQITGWGRANIDRAVRLVMAGAIPPEADITSPAWWQVLPESGTVDILGRVAAPRASAYTYQVQFAPGVQPPRWPASDAWTTVASGAGTGARTGLLATIDLTQVRAAIDAAPPVYTPADDPTSRDLPERDAFRVRVVVSDDRDDTPDAVEQRQYFSHDDPSLLPGWPKYLNADGAGSPVFADLNADGSNELVIADGNGRVHAFEADASELAGFPVHTDPIPLPSTGRNAYTLGLIRTPIDSPVLLGAPTVADLDGDGYPEVSVAALDGRVYAWDHRGRPVGGFPVSVNPNYSVEPGCQLGTGPSCDDWSAHDVRDPYNTMATGFSAAPAAGDLDPAYPGLELVAGAIDDHVYAWHADGTPVPGWPVMLGDPTKIAAVDPVTHKVTYAVDAGALRGRKVISGVSLGDANGDGLLEVATNTNEEYLETPNWSNARVPSLQSVGLVEHPGNTRTYLLFHDGTDHPQTDATLASANPDDQAYVPGWPARIGMLATELLPDVGEGSNGAPVFADLNGDGRPEILTASIAGPPYALNADGSSFYGNGPDGRFLTMAAEGAEFKNPTATDAPSVASIGGGAVGRLAPNAPPSFVMGATGLRRLLDVALPEQQLGAEDHVDAWNTSTGSFDPGFPAQVNDLMFFNTPAVADVDGDGRAEVLQSSAMYDLRAYGLGGVVPAGWPKFTGGWSVVTPATGGFLGDGSLEVALVTREGWLYVWRTGGAACQTPEWPGYQHDPANTGNYGTDAGFCARVAGAARRGAEPETSGETKP